MSRSTLTSKGQITLPKDIRDLFADYLIAEHATAHGGCSEVLTFDRALSADSRFRRL